jgi:hypothetical protein
MNILGLINLSRRLVFGYIISFKIRLLVIDMQTSNVTQTKL